MSTWVSKYGSTSTHQLLKYCIQTKIILKLFTIILMYELLVAFLKLLNN